MKINIVKTLIVVRFAASGLLKTNPACLTKRLVWNFILTSLDFDLHYYEQLLTYEPARRDYRELKKNIFIYRLPLL